MKKTRYNETRIVSIPKEADAGMKVADICRKHGISDATYSNWKSTVYLTGKLTRVVTVSRRYTGLDLNNSLKSLDTRL
jgi:putative transposase